MKYDLKRYIDEIKLLPITDMLSDSALESLSRIYMAVYNLVTTCALENEYGDGGLFRERINHLLTICRKRCAGDQSLSRRSSLLPVLHHICYGTFCASPANEEAYCSQYADEVIADWFSEYESTGSRTSEYDILRNIANLFYYVPEACKDDREYVYFKQRVSEWVATLCADSSWNGLSVHEALERLDVICRNSYMFLDATNDRQIESTFDYYFNRAIAEMSELPNVAVDDCRTLALLYEVSMFSMDHDNMKEISSLAETWLRRLAIGSEERLLCLSVYIDNLCMKMAQEIENQAFINIA